MELVILGAGTAIPTPYRSAAGVLVRVGEIPLLFDMGPGTLARLALAGVSYRDLEYVFLTHLHPDHTLDLVTFLQVNDSTPEWTRTQSVHLTGCYGTKEFYTRLLEVYPGIAPRSYPLDIRELAQERIMFDHWTIETVLTGHTNTSIGYRVEAENKVVVYSGDAVAKPELEHLARDADVFVCECAFPRGYPTDDHMTADAVGRIACTAKVKHVVLTHLYPPALAMDIATQVRTEYVGEISIAIDGLRRIV